MEFEISSIPPHDDWDDVKPIAVFDDDLIQSIVPLSEGVFVVVCKSGREWLLEFEGNKTFVRPR